MSSGTLKAGRLLRISELRPGDEQSDAVERQDQRTLDLCRREGWEDGGVYAEPDTSAYKRRRILLPDGTRGLRTVRPKFREWLTDLANGDIDAGAAYDLDRIARDPRDLEDLIDVVEETKRPVKAYTGNVMDLTTDMGIYMARSIVNHANMSSRDTARRVADKHAFKAAAGKYSGGGRRPFGYARDGVTLLPDEAEVVRAMVRLYLAGHSQVRIAEWLDEQGITPVYGGERWHPRSVGSILRSPRIAGYRVHRGKITAEAEWQGIISRDTWDEIQRSISDRTRTPGKFTRWLTRIIHCGNCDQDLLGWFSRSRPVYWCCTPKNRACCGKVSISAIPAEEQVEFLIVAFLSSPTQVAALHAAAGGAAASKARSDVADDEAQLAQLATIWAQKLITLEEYMAARAEITDRLKQAQAIARARVPAAIRRVAEADDPAAVFAAMTPHVRRDVARTVFPNGLVAYPATRRGPIFDPGRIQPRPEADH